MKARADSIEADRVRREQAAKDAADRAAASAREAAVNTLMATIYFDYDAAEIRGDAKAALDAKLPILRANSGDALGQRRAASAKRYLTDNGIDGARIAIVSYGEQRPATSGADENAWALNRRAEFEITAGGNNIVPPR
jgi:peptidoglycan-associated lipoprotein